jgi:hypothetical protein
MSRQRIPVSPDFISKWASTINERQFSAISSAKIIRHAVSIDERRAKFRADLVSHGMAARRDENLEDGIMAPDSPHHHHHDWMHTSTRYKHKSKPNRQANPAERLAPGTAAYPEVGRGRQGADKERRASRYRSHSHAHSHLSHSTNASVADPHLGFGLEDQDHRESRSSLGVDDAGSIAAPIDWDDDISSDGDEDDQDIEELWFPGGHADIGGGWENEEGETPLSHIPLVWIVREAQRSGLEFDEEKMQALDCLDDSATEAQNMPVIEISTSGGEKIEGGGPNQSRFKSLLIETASKGVLHDCLRFNQGSSVGTVIRWRMMEWLPFRRLDLTDDGLWKPIRWYV